MIHPSTMAGQNWFTGTFGATNPFQQTSSAYFRNTPFTGTPFGFGPGTNPFQNPTYGFGANPTQPFQNLISEVIRQTVPTTLASYGFANGFTTPGGFSPIGYQYQTPTWSTQFGPQFPTTPGTTFTMNQDWQNQNFLTEMIRQVTNQAIQNTFAQNPTFFNTFNTPTGGFGGNPQQNLGNVITQIAQQCCQTACQTICQGIITCANECLNQPNNPIQTNWQQQNLWNFCLQVCQQCCQSTCQTICQGIIACVNECLNQQNRTQANPFFNTQNIPFRGQTTPFSFSNTPSPYGTPSGIPTGIGAF
jgi:hypothetical protein